MKDAADLGEALLLVDPTFLVHVGVQEHRQILDLVRGPGRFHDRESLDGRLPESRPRAVGLANFHRMMLLGIDLPLLELFAAGRSLGHPLSRRHHAPPAE